MRTRMSIMESALDIFSEKNFANASVSEITARIGLSKGAFYWHFKNKQVLERLRSEERWKKLHELMIRRHEWPEDIRERVDEILHEATMRDIKQMETYIVTRQKAGRIRKSLSAHRAAVLLVSIFHGFGISQLAGALPEELPESLDILLEELPESLDILFDALTKEFSVKSEA